jgi:hypothetical protein
MLEPYKISDPYNPKNDAEENTINMAFDKCKEYFP